MLRTHIFIRTPYQICSTSISGCYAPFILAPAEGSSLEPLWGTDIRFGNLTYILDTTGQGGYLHTNLVLAIYN